ncbi:MAG: tetratricopeptide repeat protein [Bacteroidales bacterium]|jgi:tetratricopeptide (TPR) repeat protein|nr:tetratricopeptide repeat protein [Bacteroidales bacterium]
MKISRPLLSFIILAWMLIQCSPDPKSRIRELEKEISSENFSLDEKGIRTAEELIQAYVSYAESHKEGPEAPEYLYHAADLSLNINKSKESLELYNRIIYQYPDFVKVPECLFLVGYITENYMQNYGKAREIYESFIAKYPQHDFADDAAISIENMGKSPEELIRAIEEKNRQQQDTLHL